MILLVIVAVLALMPLLAILAFLVWASIKYGSVIDRIFEERPMFLPLRVAPDDPGEAVSFSAPDGLVLEGTYLKRRGRSRVGVLVFCHEYLGDRWSCIPYLDHLRDAGFDLFAFDFRNHGESGRDPRYNPLQWTTDHELRDLRAALAYLRSRPDADPAGCGLFGVSRGGSTALAVAARERDVWGVITDGAFPTGGTMNAYIARWAEIYVQSRLLLRLIPSWLFNLLGWMSRRRTGRRLHCRFPEIERAVRKLSPRPWLQIHGARDAYIGPEIAREFFACARQPKEFWLVPEAKHNRCRECEPEAYADRLRAFLARHAPRRPLPLLDEGPVDEPSENFVPAAAGLLPNVAVASVSRAGV
jgi:pimeloyl-ACP methyl ester carboxylesterase